MVPKSSAGKGEIVDSSTSETADKTKTASEIVNGLRKIFFNLSMGNGTRTVDQNAIV